MADNTVVANIKSQIIGMEEDLSSLQYRINQVSRGVEDSNLCPPASSGDAQLVHDLRQKLSELKATCNSSQGSQGNQSTQGMCTMGVPRSPYTPLDQTEFARTNLVDRVIPVLSGIYRIVGDMEMNMSGFIDPLLSRDCEDHQDNMYIMRKKCGIVDTVETHSISATLDYDTGFKYSLVPPNIYGNHCFFWKTDLEFDAFTLFDYVGALNVMSRRMTSRIGTNAPFNAIYLGDRYMCKLHLMYSSKVSAKKLYDIDQINSTFASFKAALSKADKQQVMNNFLAGFGRIDIIDYVGMPEITFDSDSRPADLHEYYRDEYIQFVPGVKLISYSVQEDILYRSSNNIQSKTMNPGDVFGFIRQIVNVNVSELIEGVEPLLAISATTRLFLACFTEVDNTHRFISEAYHGEPKSDVIVDVKLNKYMKRSYKVLFGIEGGFLRDRCLKSLESLGGLGFTPKDSGKLTKVIDGYIEIFSAIKMFGLIRGYIDFPMLGKITKTTPEVLSIDGSANYGQDYSVVFPPVYVGDLVSLPYYIALSNL